MDQLRLVLARFCKVTNIFIDPSQDEIDLSEVFSEALRKGHINETTFNQIQSCIK